MGWRSSSSRATDSWSPEGDPGMDCSIAVQAAIASIRAARYLRREGKDFGEQST
jgi:hypothetical protein